MLQSINQLLYSHKKPIHFIGVGGIGMSAIAETLCKLGVQVTGSDAKKNANTERLEKLGATIFIGHKASNIGNALVAVRSSAVKNNNIEYKAAKKAGVSVISRAAMLAEIMRFYTTISIAGSHGKTTTTTMVGCLLENSGLDPTIINGGIINHHNTNAVLGKGKYLVAEADESDGSFLLLPTDIGIITNIDPEHMDYYGTEEKLYRSFKDFVKKIPFYGYKVICNDHKKTAEIAKTIKSNLFTYGIENPSHVMAKDIKFKGYNTDFTVVFYDKPGGKVVERFECTLPTFGKHNMLNALAALSVGRALGLSPQILSNAFKNFQGTKRRFTKVAEVNGTVIIDDYAHHPVEVNATLQMANQMAESRGGKVIAFMQPHRYTRLSNLMTDFSEAFDNVRILYVAPVYSAGENPIDGITSEVLVSKIKSHDSEIQCQHLDNVDDIPSIFRSIAKSNDVVIFLGAGDITAWAYKLPEQLGKL